MMNYRQAPIGIFDSGVGGLSVAREIFARLPQENAIYFGDDRRFPYGPRPAEQVQRFALQIGDFLFGLGVKMLVAACNTVSAVALPLLAARFPVPVLGVIEDTVHYAAPLSRRKRVGVLATPSTVASNAYPRAFRAIDPQIEVVQVASQFLVNLVENGNSDKQGALSATLRAITPFRRAEVDVLILGCTHYPYLTTKMVELLGDLAQIVDPAIAVSLRVERELTARGILNETKQGQNIFYTSGDAGRFRTVGQQLEPSVQDVLEMRWQE